MTRVKRKILREILKYSELNENGNQTYHTLWVETVPHSKRYNQAKLIQEVIYKLMDL